MVEEANELVLMEEPEGDKMVEIVDALIQVDQNMYNVLSRSKINRIDYSQSITDKMPWLKVSRLDLKLLVIDYYWSHLGLIPVISQSLCCNNCSSLKFDIFYLQVASDQPMSRSAWAKKFSSVSYTRMKLIENRSKISRLDSIGR